MVRKILLAATLLFWVGACATRPESISAAYISHERYMADDCLRLATKMSDVRANLDRTSKMQDRKANGDAWGVLLLGVPFSKLSGDYQGEIAKLKGEVEAIETAQIKNKCK